MPVGVVILDTSISATRRVARSPTIGGNAPNKAPENLGNGSLLGCSVGGAGEPECGFGIGSPSRAARFA